MIQRIQTIWLALAAIFEGLTFQFPFYTGDWKEDSVNTAVNLKASTTTGFTVVTIIVIVIAVLSIFLFKNRPVQRLLCATGVGASAAAVGLYAYEMKDFFSGSIDVWALIYIAVIIFFILAIRSISADEKLIKSMDRLR